MISIARAITNKDWMFSGAKISYLASLFGSRMETPRALRVEAWGKTF